MQAQDMEIKLGRFSAGMMRLPRWQFSDEQLLSFIQRTLELGIHTFDHAKVYQSERQFGKALSKSPGLRQRIRIVSKCGIRLPGRGEHGALAIKHYDSSRDSIIRSLEDSLEQLQTDYIDVLLIHRPDYLAEADQIAAAFAHLRQQGKVRYFGVSNFSVAQFELLQSRLDFKLVTNQIELSPFHLQALDDGTLDQCQRLRISPMLWSCLGGGRLFDPNHPLTQTLLPVLQSIAAECGAENPQQLIYAWLLALPSAPNIILGSGNLERNENLTGAQHLHLSREQWYTILQAASGHPVK